MAQPKVWFDRDENLWYDGVKARFIDSGANGQVWQVCKRIGKDTYTRAVKVVNPELGRKEYKLVRQFAKDPPLHENIIRLYGCIDNPPLFCFEYEFIETDLYHATSEMWGSGSGLSDSVIASIALKLLHGLQHIHSKGFVHGDLKINNVLVSKNFEIVKITDFGTTRKVKLYNKVHISKVYTTYFYAAPEVFKLEMTYKSDIFSFGVICYNLWSATEYGIQFPFYPGDWKDYDQECQHIAKKRARDYVRELGGSINEGQGAINLQKRFDIYYPEVLATALRGEPLRPKNPNSLLNKEEAAFEFLKKCLKLDYKERFSASDAIQYDFLQKVISTDTPPRSHHQHSQPEQSRPRQRHHDFQYPASTRTQYMYQTSRRQDQS